MPRTASQWPAAHARRYPLIPPWRRHADLSRVPVVRHRLAWNGPPGTSRRLAQVRAGTLALLSPGQEPQPPAAQACASCGGAGFTSGQGDDLAAVTRLRPPAATQIDQCHLDAESLNRRLTAITALRPAASSRVAFAGDDDLASVALLRAAPPAALLVADIDERVLAVIAAEAARLGISGTAVLEQLNLTRPDDLSGLLDRHGESYDVVVTDPPYAEDGMRTFIQAAMALTGIGGGCTLRSRPCSPRHGATNCYGRSSSN